MAIVGGVVLIIIGIFLIWLALASKFEKIGNKVANKIDKTFKEDKGESKQ